MATRKVKRFNEGGEGFGEGFSGGETGSRGDSSPGSGDVAEGSYDGDGAGAFNPGDYGLVPDGNGGYTTQEGPGGIYKKGGMIKKYAKGGYVKSADGIAQRGKTKGRMC